MPLCILWRREGNQVMGGFHSGGATIILSYIRGTPSGGLQPIHGGGGEIHQIGLHSRMALSPPWETLLHHGWITKSLRNLKIIK